MDHNQPESPQPGPPVPEPPSADAYSSKHQPAEHSPVTANCPTAAPRRVFFRWVTGGLSAVAGAVLGIPVIGYFLGRRPRTAAWVTIGPVESFPTNETRLVTFDSPLRQSWDGVAAHTGVFVRNEGADGPNDKFLVLAVNCAHLGCPVSWFPQSGLFMCPCHGGVYYANGERASGPPPRGLFRCVWRVEAGKLQVQAPRFPTLQDTLTETA